MGVITLAGYAVIDEKRQVIKLYKRKNEATRFLNNNPGQGYKWVEIYFSTGLVNS